MKYKDYFLKLKETGKITNEEFDKFIDTVPEGEIPDAVFQVLDSTFLTTERALSHKDVVSKLKVQTLNPIDTEIKNMLKYLPAETVLEIEREQNTYKKAELITAAIPLAIQKASKAPNDEEAKKKVQELQTANQEMLAKFEKLNSERETERNGLKSDYEKQIKNFKLESELEKRANSYTLAEGYSETKNTITKALLSEIKAKNKLDLIEKDGEFDISILDEHGSPRFENNGNTPVTIKSLLDATFKPFLKVNNAGEDKTKQSQTTQQYKVQNQNPSVRRGVDTSVEM